MIASQKGAMRNITSTALRVRVLLRGKGFKLARLRRFCSRARATGSFTSLKYTGYALALDHKASVDILHFHDGATARLVAGRAPKRPEEPSDPSFDGGGQVPVFPSPDSDGPPAQ